MPELSRFFGIIVRMYWEANAPHHRPHFHAYYQDDVAIYAIDEVELIAGALPRRQQRLVEAWAEIASTGVEKGLGEIAGRPKAVPYRPAPLIEEQNMIHRVFRVVSFEIVGPYEIKVKFDDGFQTTIDFQPVLAGELYSPLRNLEIFNRVTIDSEVHTLVWPNGADFDPATLHDWPEHVDAMTGQARSWEHMPV